MQPAGKSAWFFLTYFWGVPRTVAEFVDEMKVEADNPYVFAAATCGGLAGGVLGIWTLFLRKRGFIWIME